jgi:hypothetical protein
MPFSSAAAQHHGHRVQFVDLRQKLTLAETGHPGFSATEKLVQRSTVCVPLRRSAQVDIICQSGRTHRSDVRMKATEVVLRGRRAGTSNARTWLEWCPADQEQIEAGMRTAAQILVAGSAVPPG